MNEKTVKRLKTLGIYLLIYAVIFYGIPGALYFINYSLFDKAAPILLMIFNNLTVLLLCNFECRYNGFHILDVFLPAAVFVPSAFLFYAPLQYAYLAGVLYLICGFAGCMLAEMTRKRENHTLL